jgi:transposase-like protein
MHTPDVSADAALRDAILYFDYAHSHEFMVHVRWPDGKVKCPACGGERVTYLAKNKVWKCYAKHPKARFSLKTGTIFEDSPLSLEKWLPAVWIFLNAKEGISSGELHRALGMTQKTAWFMLHRIRLALRNTSFDKLLEAHAPPMNAGPFENTPEFRRFCAGMKRLLEVSKRDLGRRIQEAKLNSDRIDNPKAPGRKRQVR